MKIVGFVGRSFGVVLRLPITPKYAQQNQMTTITKSITFKWKLSFNDSYRWTQEGELYNARTMRKIKKTVNGYSIGYWISGKFYTLKNLKKSIVKIETEFCPF